jgi:cell division protein FtsL
VSTIPERRVHPAGTARARPDEIPQPRPDLRIVVDGELSARARRRRRRLVAVAMAVVLCASLFGVVAFHVVLTEGQLELERLQARASAEQSRNTRLRLEVAQLESPEWIVNSAINDGMVPPDGTTYLTPPPSSAASR